MQSTPTASSHQRSHSGGLPVGTGKAKKFRRSWSSQKKVDYNFSTENDIHGIVMLEIHGATDLPRLKNSESAFPSFW
jgi:phosphatidylserine decarboxylase